MATRPTQQHDARAHFHTVPVLEDLHDLQDLHAIPPIVGARGVA